MERRPILCVFDGWKRHIKHVTPPQSQMVACRIHQHVKFMLPPYYSLKYHTIEKHVNQMLCALLACCGELCIVSCNK